MIPGIWSSASIVLFGLTFCISLFIHFENRCCHFTDIQNRSSPIEWRILSALQWHNRTIYSNCRRYNSDFRTIMMETIEWEFIQLIVNANFDLKEHTHANFSIKNSELWLQLEWTIRYLPKWKRKKLFALFAFNINSSN